MTGDAGEVAEWEMMSSGIDLTSVVCKFGRHDSDTSSSRPLLCAAAPAIAIISSGVDKQFGHSHEETLERVADVGAAALRTDELSAIEVTTDGQRMW